MKFFIVVALMHFYCSAISQSKMELVIPKGHADVVDVLLTTKDGRYMLSGGSGTVNFYDLKINKLLKAFSIKYRPSSHISMAFNQMQTKVIISSEEEIKILQLSDLSIRTIDFVGTNKAIFGENDSYIYVAGYKGAYKIDLSTQVKNKIFKTLNEDVFFSVALDKNGKTVHFGTKGKLMHSYNIVSKTVTEHSVSFFRDVLPNGIIFSFGYTGKVAESPVKMAFYNPSTMQEIMSITDDRDKRMGNYISLYLQDNYSTNFWSFDERKNQLFVATSEEIIVCDFTNNTIKTLLKFPFSGVNSITTTSNPDIFYLGYGRMNKKLGIQKYDITKNILLGAPVEVVLFPMKIYPARHNNGFVVANGFSEKINYFQISSSRQKVTMNSWDSIELNTGIIHAYQKNTYGNPILSPDGKLLIAASDSRGVDNELILSDAESPKETVYFKTPNGISQDNKSIAFTADGKILAVFCTNEIQLINVANKKNTKTISVKGENNNVWEFSNITDMLPDGSVLFTTYQLPGNNKDHITAISSVTGLPLWDKELNLMLSYMQLNESGDKLFVGSFSYNKNEPPVLMTLNPLSGEVLNSVDFPSDGPLINSMNRKKTMISSIGNIFNVRTKEKIIEIPELYNSVEFLKNDSLVIANTNEGIKIYDIFLKKELAKIIMYANSNEYIVITPDGLFDGTEKAINSMYFVKSKEIIPLASFFEIYYTPNLLARILSKQNLPLVKNISELNIRPTIKIQYEEKQRNLTVADDVATYQNTSGVATLIVSASAPADKVDEIRLFHNGKIVNLATRGLFVTEDASGAETKKYTINLLPGNNSFKALALNTQRTESKADEMVVVYTDNKAASVPLVTSNNKVIDPIDKNATLHLLVVGIDKYQNKAMRLNYAMADAKAFKAEIEKDAASVIGNIKTYLVYDEDANKQGITTAFNNVKKSTQPQDVFVFYYAGHGVISEKNKEFYLVPNDVIDLKNADVALQQNGISSKMLQQYAIDISAQKQVFILDACQSAGAFEQLVATDATQQKNIANVARSTGTHWIAASGSQQYATEFSALGHGAFTYVLLQALNGEAASNKMITINGLKTFLQVQVPALMKKYNGSAQLPSSYGFGNDFPVEVIK